MPTDPALKIKINLNKKSKEKLDNVVYKWAINIGRMLILVTELIALMALFYRFVIDRKIIDLHDKIKSEQNFVLNQAAREKEFRAIQQRLAVIKLVKEQTDFKLKIMNDITEASNQNIFTQSNLLVDTNSISVDGITANISLLQNFVSKLQEYPQVLSMSIDQINSTSQGVLFRLNIELKDDTANL